MAKLTILVLIITLHIVIFYCINTLDKLRGEKGSLQVQVAFLKQVHEKRINVGGTILKLQTLRHHYGSPVRHLYIVTDKTTNKLYFKVNRQGNEIIFELNPSGQLH